MFRKVILLLLVCIPCFRAECDNCYSEYWQQFFWKMWEKESVVLGTFVRVDSGNHLRNVRSFQINEQLIWNVSKKWNLQLHYAYVNGRDVVAHSLWKYQNRLELEINRIFFIFNYCILDTRNRLEIRRIRGQTKTNYRFRQKTMFTVPFNDRGALKSFSVENELFYDVNNHFFMQDRLCPIKLKFELSKNVDMDLFFFVRFFHHDTLWHKSVVFGTQLNF